MCHGSITDDRNYCLERTGGTSITYRQTEETITVQGQGIDCEDEAKYLRPPMAVNIIISVKIGIQIPLVALKAAL